jgi:hypothetical protein
MVILERDGQINCQAFVPPTSFWRRLLWQWLARLQMS